MPQLNACIIAESLDDPMVLNRLTVYRVFISDDGRKLDQRGGTGRWHVYWVPKDRSRVCTRMNANQRIEEKRE